MEILIKLASDKFKEIVTKYTAEFFSRKSEVGFDVTQYFPDAFNRMQKEVHEAYISVMDQADAEGIFTNELSIDLHDLGKRHCENFIRSTVAI